MPPFEDPEEFDFEKLKAGEEEEWAKLREKVRPIALAEATHQLVKFSVSKQISLPQDAELVADETISGKWRKTKGHFSGGIKQGIENARIHPPSSNIYGAAKGYAHDLAHEFGKAAKEIEQDEENENQGSKRQKEKRDPNSSTPDTIVWGRDVMAKLAKCVEEKLKGKEFQITEERYNKDLKYEEISKTLDIPTGTIGVYLQNAHKKLRKCLEQHGINGSDLYGLIEAVRAANLTDKSP